MIAMQEVTDLGGYLRDATLADIDLLFEWANEPSVRKNSFSTEEITYEEHQRWYSELLERKDSRQYIYVYDGEDVGQARITTRGEEAEIGYSICAERRGMGHGKNLLQLLYNKVREDFPEVKKLIARVKPDNVASQRAFLDVGYVKKYEAFEICLEEEKEYSDNILRGGVLYLTNNQNALELYEWLEERCQSNIYSGRLTIEQIGNLKPELIISYNYKYIITQDIIEYMRGNIVNLHISYLPWNRGANPNFWSFIDNTPKGVTIHYVSSGLDKGAIAFQKKLELTDEETFSSSYERLNYEIVQLFKQNWLQIKNRQVTPFYPTEKGSYHSVKDFQEFFSRFPFSWDDKAVDLKRRINE